MKEKFHMFTPSTTKVIYKDTMGFQERSEITSLYVENFYKRFLGEVI
jgi:hypothetical protein